MSENTWQAIEAAPKDGTPVLIAQLGKHGWYIDTAVNFHDVDESGKAQDRWFARESAEQVCDAPTHWMPLPEPPAE